MTKSMATVGRAAGATARSSAPVPAAPTFKAGRPRSVSIIISSYNYGRYVAQAIQSARQQDFSGFDDWELVVVDDGSTDDSAQVIEQICRRPRRGERLVFLRQRNAGQTAAINTGFAASRGEMVVFLDADDFLLPGAVQAHAEGLAQAGVVRSQGYMRVVDARGQTTGARTPQRPAPDGDTAPQLAARGPGAVVSTANSGNAWRREFLRDIFPLPTAGALNPDALLMDSAPFHGWTVTLDHPVAAYRRHPANISSAIAAFSLANIDKVLDARARRAAWMAQAAGEPAGGARWLDEDWRIATLRHLSGRLGGASSGPSLRRHLSAAMKIDGRPSKKLALAAAVCAVRAAPRPAAVALARRMIHLEFM